MLLPPCSAPCELAQLRVGPGISQALATPLISRKLVHLYWAIPGYRREIYVDGVVFILGVEELLLGFEGWMAIFILINSVFFHYNCGFAFVNPCVTWSSSISMCDRILENPPYVIFCENWVWCVFDKLYPRANPSASLKPIALFALKIACFVCDRATTRWSKKLQSKGVAMHAYGVSVYHACTGNQLSQLGRSCPKWAQSSSSSRIQFPPTPISVISESRSAPSSSGSGL